MIVIKVCSHSRDLTEYLTSFSTDIFVRLLILNLLSVLTPNISTSLLKFANVNYVGQCFDHYTVTFFMISHHTILTEPITHCHETFPILNKLIHSTWRVLSRHSLFFYCLFRVLKIFTFCLSLLWCNWTSNSVS